MRFLRFILVFSFLVFVSAFHAYGATLLYSPASYSIALSAGSQAVVSLTAQIEADSDVYYVWFVDSTDGSLPPEWVQAAPGTDFIGFGSASASTLLTISVPEGTPAGTYAGNIFSSAMSSHGYANEGVGIYVEIIVPSDCGGIPVVSVDSVTPSYLWPPNNRTEPVTITGQVSLPENCTLHAAGYSVDDEYGIYSIVGEFTVDELGAFSLSVPLVVSREGSDADGRLYTITIYAEDEAGIATSQGIDVTVHDQGNK